MNYATIESKRYLFLEVTPSAVLSSHLPIAGLKWIVTNEYGVTLHEQKYVIDPDYVLLSFPNLEFPSLLGYKVECRGQDLSHVVGKLVQDLEQADAVLIRGLSDYREVLRSVLGDLGYGRLFDQCLSKCGVLSADVEEVCQVAPNPFAQLEFDAQAYCLEAI